MRKVVTLAALALCITVGAAQDATSVLGEADKALGASSLKSIR